MKFSEFALSDSLLQAIEAAGYTAPTPIQEQAIPAALEGRDVLGIAQTGTGKTGAFVLPMIARLEKGRARARMPRSLILCPTRELAAQVADNFKTLGTNHKLAMALLIGGVSFDEQARIIDRGADVLIATPGRLLDHFGRGKLLLNAIEILVIDEADRMLDMGFIPDIERIVKLLPFTRQTLFFSATMPDIIQKLVREFLHTPVTIEVARQATTASTITQAFKFVAENSPAAKRAALRELIRGVEVRNAIIFCNRKRDVGVLQRSLIKHNFSSGELHGDMDQHTRTKTLDAFRNNEIQLLCASDVAARGLDIPSVSHVFNYDIPTHAEDYVHRIGRTGRAGKEGHSFSLVTPDDLYNLDAIQKLCQIEQPTWVDGPPDLNAQSHERGGRHGRSRGRGKGRGGREGDRERVSESVGGSVSASAHAQPARGEDRRSPKPPAQQPQPQPHQSEPRSQQSGGGKRPERERGRHRSTEAAPVVGMGDHVPAFMVKAIKPTP
jgi:superfamily II DNA/RNA helicase